MPKISVIVPVYKVESYIQRCVESILSQNYRDFELILVDDGSPDNCPAICDHYAAHDMRVKVIHQMNQGVSAARNNGVSIAKGEYVTFIDSDDYVASNYLDVLYRACKEYSADIGLVNYIGTRGEVKFTLEGAELHVLDGQAALEKYGVESGHHIRLPVCKLIKREIVEKHPFPLGRVWGEDTACVYMWLWEANRVAETSLKLYAYYQREGSAVSTLSGNGYMGIIYTYDEMVSFFHKQGLEKLKDRYIYFLLLMTVHISQLIDKGNIEMHDMLSKCQKNALGLWNISEKQFIENHVAMARLLKRYGHNEYVLEAIQQIANTYAGKKIDKEQRSSFRKQLRGLLQMERINIWNAAIDGWIFEIAYPREMNAYWIAKAQVEKLSNHIKRENNYER